MSEKVQTALSPAEVRLIAVLRQIKQFNKPHLIAEEDAGVVLSLLQTTESNLERLETELSADELKLFLKGFVEGLAASKIQEVPSDLYELSEEDTPFVGGPTGGAAVGQGTDERFVTQTGPQN